MNSKLSLRIFEFLLDSKKQVLDVADTAEYEDTHGIYRFPLVQFTSDILDEGPVVNKTLVIQVVERYVEIVKKTKEFINKERVFGEMEVKMRDVLEKARTQIMTFDVKND
jgi:hypothetical protein